MKEDCPYTYVSDADIPSDQNDYTIIADLASAARAAALHTLGHARLKCRLDGIEQLRDSSVVPQDYEADAELIFELIIRVEREAELHARRTLDALSALRGPVVVAERSGGVTRLFEEAIEVNAPNGEKREKNATSIPRGSGSS